MKKQKLFCIVSSKRWRKYNSYCGTQGPIKTNLIKRSFRAIYPEHKWYSDVTEFKLNDQKTYLSPIIDGCAGDYRLHHFAQSQPQADQQTVDMLRQASGTKWFGFSHRPRLAVPVSVISSLA